ncbi:MAG: glycosyltransferase family 2 protein [Planctomycetes bacterium]|nr:glycosyltransferase family 2 protein [Planctomycetota bacterium]
MTPVNEPEKPDISIVVPMHNEEGNVQPLHEAVCQVATQLSGRVEIVLVNDGSTDHTLERLEQLAARDERVRIVDLDGNWGQAGAFCAGFETARGNVILTMDGDLQNDPADFPKALAKLEEGYRAVSGWRRDRQERYWDRVLPSRCANWLIGLATGIPLHDVGCGLKAYRAEVVKGRYLPRGFNRFMPAIFGLQAHEVAEIAVQDRKRHSGTTHYGLKRIVIVFRDLLAIPAILHSPGKHLALMRFLRLAGAAGLGLALLALVRDAQRGPLLPGRLHLLASALGLAAVVLASHLIGWNLGRYLDTQESKGFRIRQVIERR